ncbi:MAG: hypothetical protein IPH31_23025 [Lewinellaceae bacterium]|nr:hypothetical protein [Lewinellaceae bacterium]
MNTAILRLLDPALFEVKILAKVFTKIAIDPDQPIANTPERAIVLPVPDAKVSADFLPGI